MCMYVCMYVCMYYVCMYVCVSVCMHVGVTFNIACGGKVSTEHGRIGLGEGKTIVSSYACTVRSPKSVESPISNSTSSSGAQQE
jgi:hypothetical protein